MSSAMLEIASVKKSILFDVLSVIDRANKATKRNTLSFEYSLLKEETVKRYDKIYRIARNHKEMLAAAFYILPKKPQEYRVTVLYEYLFDKAFEMVSVNELLDYIKQENGKTLIYYIAEKCISDTSYTREDIEKAVKESDFRIIEMLNKSRLPEKVKMSVNMMLFQQKEFIDTLSEYINYVHEYIRDIYVDYREVFENFKLILIESFKDKSKSKNLLTTFVLNRIATDGIERKQIIILSLIRLEYSWIKHDEKKMYHIRGLFFCQRILHSSSFTIF